MREPTDRHSGYRYRCHGLDLDSDEPLPGLRAGIVGDAAVVKLATEVGDHFQSWPGDSDAVIIPVDERRSGISAVWHDSELHVRVANLLTARIDETLSVVRYGSAEHSQRQQVATAVTTSLLALLSTLRCEQAVFHASGVGVNGRALALMGHTGTGKSTLALAACAAGARLISEDALAIDRGEDLFCLPGNTSVTVKGRKARTLDRLAPALPREAGADGRVTYLPLLAEDAALPLGAIVMPIPSRRVGSMTVHRMRPVEAFFRLMNFPRIAGVQHVGVSRLQFEVAGAIARSTPVFAVAIPWDPIPANIGESLLALLDHAN